MLKQSVVVESRNCWSTVINEVQVSIWQNNVLQLHNHVFVSFKQPYKVGLQISSFIPLKRLDKSLADGIQENFCQLLPNSNTERRAGFPKNDTVLRANVKQILNSPLQNTCVMSFFISSYCPFLEKIVEAFLFKTKWEVENFMHFLMLAM